MKSTMDKTTAKDTLQPRRASQQLSFKIPNLKRGPYILWTVFDISSMLATAFMIHRFDTRTFDRLALSPLGPDVSLVELFQKVFTNPTTSVFLAACLTFAVSLTHYILVHYKDESQTFFILFGLLVAQIADAVYTGMYTEGGVYVMLLKSFVPVSVVGAVVLSALCHRLLRLRGKPDVDGERM